jgi:4-hydroxy-3-methylbut-2-enyl diphosphate reductase
MEAVNTMDIETHDKRPRLNLRYLPKILLARPRGFCAGVKRAIETVEQTLRRVPPPVYVLHEIVHNTHVVRDLGNRGARFVETIADVPERSVLIFSAHGVAPWIRAEAEAKALRIIDATCPLVTKVHLEARRYAKEGKTILLVGHQGHEEVIGTMGEAPDHIRLLTKPEDVARIQVADAAKVAVITQTTLSLDETRHMEEIIRRRFPSVATPVKEDVCYATTNRQRSVKSIAARADLILVIGSKNSSNSRRLAEVAKALGCRAYLVEDVTEIEPHWLEDARTIGITAGASAPEYLVTEVLNFFQYAGVREIEELTSTEDERIRFRLPAELATLVAASGT